jgi:DNA-binding NtrC family response regulator
MEGEAVRETLEAGDGGNRHAVVQRFRLTVAEGPDAGRAFLSGAERVVVGTHESADFVLTDRTVSRFHCEIRLAGGGASIRDLSSRNGTELDRVRIIEAHLFSQAELALGKTRIRFELGADQVEVPLLDRPSFGALVGTSDVMRAVFARLFQAAGTESTVLLEGETGTGKDAAALAVHASSSRRDGPFIVIDCAALPKDLLESELFGHERGAFTGAVERRRGAFDAASGGTVFLDEIGELDPALQPKLLRVLETREVRRLGSEKAYPVDVRVIAATNRNLRAEVNAGRFRPDLYYRLAVLQIRLPALREHAEDLACTIDCIAERLGIAERPEVKALCSPDQLRELAGHPWPGNVRELRNLIERTVAGDGASAAPESAQAVPLDFRSARAAFERQYLEQILAAHGGNLTAAARAARLDRVHFYRLLWKHGLR